MIHEICNRVTLFTFPALLTLAMLAMHPGDVYSQEDTDAALSLQFNLEQCLDKALHDNRRRPVSRYKRGYG